MPYGTCQGDYSCDSCNCSMPRESFVWIDLKKRKLYCMTCKPEEALLEDKPRLTPTQKKILIMKVLLKIFRKKNKKLEMENLQLKRQRATEKGKQLTCHAV